MAIFPPKLRNQLFGTPFGEVFPPKANPNFLAIDGRTAALHVLRDYVCALTFFRSGGQGKPAIPFSIDPGNFYIEWPDSSEDMTFPSIAIVHSRADYDVIGLTSYIEEDTRDVFAPGTVLQWQSEYTETINLELWVAKQSERRGLLGALETAFTPTEQMSGLRFAMPEYYGELVCFTLNRREVMDEPDSARNRRRAQLEMEMRFNIVALVNYVPLTPTIQTKVDYDQDTGLPIDITTNPNAQLSPNFANPNAAPTNTFRNNKAIED
jgi:hypothetical protein